MRGYVGKRAAGAALTLVVVSIVVFSLVRIIPGDATAAIFGAREYDPVAAAQIRAFYGLDEPILAQYFAWIGSIFHGDLGISLLSQEPVGSLLLERIPRTLYLMAGGVLFGLVMAVPTGIVAARFRGRWPDSAVVTLTTLAMSIPQFFAGLLLILLFAVQLRWLPPAGFVQPSEDPAAWLRSMILPWATIGIAIAAIVARVLRSSLLDVLSSDYIRTARARGLSERRVVLRHALRNASIPAITVVGLEIGYLIGGAIIVEKVFAFPGMGQLIVNSIQQRDYPVVQASIFFFAAAFVLVNLLTDLLYTWLDPRVRVSTR